MQSNKSGVLFVKKRLLYLSVILLMIIFILIPIRTSSLYIRIYFDDNEAITQRIEGDSCTLFYTTDTLNAFSTEQMITSAINYEDYNVTFCLEPTLKGHIKTFRIDLPNQEQLVNIKNITISSGGVIKQQFNPCDFFEQKNIVSSNDIYALDLATAQGIVYIGTLSEDPYIVLSEELSQEIVGNYSQFRATRLAICCFIIGCFVLSKKIFSKEGAVTLG